MRPHCPLCDVNAATGRNEREPRWRFESTMYQDLSTAYLAAQAEQLIIAQRAERAWIKAEANLQDRFIPRPSAKARIIAVLSGLGLLAGRRTTQPTAVRSIRPHRSTGAL